MATNKQAGATIQTPGQFLHSAPAMFLQSGLNLNSMRLYQGQRLPNGMVVNSHNAANKGKLAGRVAFVTLEVSPAVAIRAIPAARIARYAINPARLFAFVIAKRANVFAKGFGRDHRIFGDHLPMAAFIRLTTKIFAADG